MTRRPARVIRGAWEPHTTGGRVAHMPGPENRDMACTCRVDCDILMLRGPRELRGMEQARGVDSHSISGCYQAPSSRWLMITRICVHFMKILDIRTPNPMILVQILSFCWGLTRNLIFFDLIIVSGFGSYQLLTFSEREVMYFFIEQHFVFFEKIIFRLSKSWFLWLPSPQT